MADVRHWERSDFQSCARPKARFKLDAGNTSWSETASEVETGRVQNRHHPVLEGKRLSDLDILLPFVEDDMSLLSPSRTYFPEKSRFAAGQGQAGRFRVNVQIGKEQSHITLQLPELRTFNYIMDELQPIFALSDYQRTHTRIFLQTIVGETEILVNSRPNFGTDRNIDYIGIPANPMKLTRIQRHGALWFFFSLVFLFSALGLGTFVLIEFLVLRPRLASDLRNAFATNSPQDIFGNQAVVPPAVVLPPTTTATSSQAARGPSGGSPAVEKPFVVLPPQSGAASAKPGMPPGTLPGTISLPPTTGLARR